MQGRASRTQRALAAALLLLLVPLAPSAPAAAYPGTVDTFAGGADELFAEVPSSLARAYLGALRLPSNATVLAATATVAPGWPQSASWQDGGASGFAAGHLDGGASLSGAALSLALRSGATEFEGGGFDAGTFAGTQRLAAGVRPVAVAGAYTTPAISWDGTSYGRLIAHVVGGPAGTARFDVVDGAGALLQANLSRGAVISVDGATHPSIRIRASLSGPSPAEAPTLVRLGAGYSLFADMGPGATGPSLSGAALYAAALELEESVSRWTESASNPVSGPAPGTWHHIGPILGGRINVGGEIWQYIDSSDNGGASHIGRMVSADGGNTWAFDAQPLLNQSPGQWDSGFVGGAEVVRDPSGLYRMWYHGAQTPDLFSIGYAYSSDGITWTKHPSNPVFTRAASGWDDHNVGWPTVADVSGTYYMWYGGRNTTDARKSIGLATSGDGITWARASASPVVAHGATPPGNYDINPSDVLYEGGSFTLYWTCGASAAGTDTCVSTSTNGMAWTHDAANPILTHGDAPWDGFSAEVPLRTVDPTTGHSLLFFSGRPATTIYSMGRADPHRVASGTYARTFDLQGERPRSFLRSTGDASVPANTALALALSTSADNATFSPPEAVLLDDAALASAPSAYLRFSAALSTSAVLASPSLRSLRLDYDRFAGGGAFTSAATRLGGLLQSATVSWAGTAPNGTSVAVLVSADDGATWEPAVAGTARTFLTAGRDFRYRLDLVGTSDAAPVVTAVNVTLTSFGAPADLRLEAQDGTLLGGLSGPLSSPTSVSLNLTALNDALAAVGGLDPPLGIDVVLYARGSSPGAVSISNVSVALSFADELHASFWPEAAAIELTEGAGQAFTVSATTTGGASIAYSWFVDGTQDATAGPDFSFVAGPGSAGTHTLRAAVSNGQFSAERSWSVNVSAPPARPGGPLPTRPLLVDFSPPADAVVPFNETVLFTATLREPAAPPVTYAWQVYGGLNGTADAGSLALRGTVAGAYFVSVTVRNATGIETHAWNLTVLPPAPGDGAPVGNGARPVQTGAEAAALLAALAGLSAAAVLAALWVRERSRRRPGEP